MTPGFSMMGSGIYSVTQTYEMVCAEQCLDCGDNECKAIWQEDFETDDWGNIDQMVECKQCGHGFNFVKEA
jgi:hypothetical protein